MLTLGDVLSRIPTHYLKPGTHDAKRELRFKVNDLSSDIARGRAAVPLSRIAQLLPEIFVKEISSDEDTEVRLPLQKLVEQIGLLRSQPKPSGVEKMARPVTPIELPPGIKSVLPIEAKQETPVLPVVEVPRPAPEQPLSPPIILVEPVSVPRTFELKPAVEQASVPPVILAPPPVVEAPVVSEVPAPPVPAPVPAPAPAIIEVMQVVGPPQPAAESIPSVPPIPAAPVVAPPVAPEPQKIVLDWGPHVPASIEENKEAAQSEAVIVPPSVEAVIEPPHVESAPVVESQKLAPVESPELETGEEKIQLSLAAILRQCPPEIIVGQLPHVDDSVRITLPFAPIDRQLVKGHVEVSALRFIVALPEIYQKYFVAKVGVKVPIPLEEVFQNLPAPKQELTVAPPTEAPVFLTFAPPAAPAAGDAPIVSAPVEKVEEQPAAAAPASEAKAVEPPLPSVESPKIDAPVIPAAIEEVPPAVSVLPPPEVVPAFSVVPPPPAEEPPPPIPSVPPAVDLSTPLTLEKAVPPPPPLPLVAEIPPSVVEPPPIPSVAASSSPEPLPALPAELVPSWWSASPAFLAANGGPPTDLRPASPTVAASETPANPVVASEAQSAVAPAEITPPPLPVPPAAASEPSAAAEAPKLSFQPPVFRPHFVPPPPIFGFAPPAVVSEPEPEPVAKLEPPSVLPGLMESAVVQPVPPTENIALEVNAAPEAAAIVAAPAEPPPLPVAEVQQPPTAEAPIETRSESEPSSELIASAGEHSAPDIAHFSDEPVPYADLAESLAHETTYATALAEVVNVDRPEVEAAEPKSPVVVDATSVEPPVAEKPAEMAEHRAVPIVEGLAVAAVAATIAEHVPLDFHQVSAPIEEPKAPEETAAPAETPAAAALPAEIEHKVEEPAVVHGAVFAEKSTEPLAEPIAEVPLPPVESAAQVETPATEREVTETPAAPEPEPPAAAVPPPPPQPPFLLPRLPSETVHLEVLPSPVRRFDQDAVQALFMTEEALDLPKVSRLAAALPGVYACVIATRDQACTGGTLPEGFDLAALLGLAPRVGEAAGRMPIGQLKHFTLYGDAYSVSFFERNGLSLCAVHRPRSFVPGVREKLVALADELSR
ncbi:hypothetical protein [Chthoniobacter sp.]|uniref:hypothetical protein n=1 Tax=Chthoniobacter sp. TaxID=2510640 RepID=UPI0032AFBE14